MSLSVKKVSLAVGLSALALGGTVTSAAAQPVPTGEFQALACIQPVGPAHVHGRTIRLWRCDAPGGGYHWHGQLIGGQQHDAVWLRSAAGTVTFTTYVPAGASSVDTPDVGPHGGPWSACGKAFDLPQEACTGAN
ncbi:hypothetical protein ACQPZF_15395 [Actinosynnema sp. CS-041913]|uniref:hypothetical protein n=1 Tax=Actinosynnema sp. CS-041913 TaxID=3239917 RepID=UPI003D8A30CF